MTGISGVGVMVASAGALLVYAGLKGENPLLALRDIASGSPSAIDNTAGTHVATIPGTLTGGGSIITGATGYPPLLRAVSQYDGDKYSQAKRWQPGFSDCSSYIGKGFKALGITPPGASTTIEYLTWHMLFKLPDEHHVGPGDLLISTSHMAVVVDLTHAKGQQNTRENVRTDSFKNIMAGSGAWGYYRYDPTRRNVSA